MYACLDIGGTSIKVAISDKDGHLMEKGHLDVDKEFDVIMERIVCWINTIKQNYDVEGIAISAPGSVDCKTGIIGGASAVPCIHGPNWKEILNKKTDLPVSIENDANCAALAEIFSGRAKNMKDILFIVCGTGIGGAIIKDGKIHHGKHLYGGEIGYMIMEEHDGRYFTFSDVGSTMSFVRKVRKHYNDDSWNGKSVFEAANQGNQLCIDVIDTFYTNLAKGIFNLQHIYDPEIILLGGAISQREDFVARINEKLHMIRESMLPLNTLMPKIDTCTHKNDANLIGALAHFLAEHENGER